MMKFAFVLRAIAILCRGYINVGTFIGRAKPFRDIRVKVIIYIKIVMIHNYIYKIIK